MPVLPLIQVSEAPLSIRSFFANGDPGPIVSSLAHVPELLQKTMPFIAAALGPSGIDFRTKEIIVLRTSAIMSCSFCTNLHTVVAEQTGLTSEQLHALRGETDVGAVGFTKKELCLIQWCDAMGNGTAPVPTELTKTLSSLYSEAEVVEFGIASGCTIMLNRYASALHLPTATPHLEWLETNGFTICN